MSTSKNPKEERVVNIIPGYLPICELCPFKDAYFLSKENKALSNQLRVSASLPSEPKKPDEESIRRVEEKLTEEEIQEEKSREKKKKK